MKRFFSSLYKSAPKDKDSSESRYFRIVIWAFLGIFVLTGLAGLSAFLLTLRGEEETMVPDMAGDELIDALLRLQERGLYPEIQLRYYSDPAMKDHVIAQNPEPGTYVRAGRRIGLVVSQGAIIDRIADYRGRLLSDVQAELAAMFPTSEKLLTVGPLSYVFDESPVGTIIEQDPIPDSEISGSTVLSFVVSRGPDVEMYSLPSFIGLSWEDAISILARENVPFEFNLEDQPTIGQEGVVTGQSPDPGTEVVAGTPVKVTIRDVRDIPEGYIFGMFDRTLPEYAVAVELSAVALGPEGEPSTLFSMSHPGGKVVFPYLLEQGSTIILYRYDTEVVRLVVREDEDQ